MISDIYIKRNLFYRNYDIQYSTEIQITDNSSAYQKFAWKLLHFVLPRDIRTGGQVTNIKGLKYNNLILNGLKTHGLENEEFLFKVSGINPPEENSNINDEEEADQSFEYKIKTEFADFPDRKNIRYKSNIYYDGEIADFANSPVFVEKEKLELKELFLGMEFFEPNFFAYIGFAPKIKRSLVIQSYDNMLFARFRAEQIKNPEIFFDTFADIGTKISECLYDLSGDNIAEDCTKLITERLS